MSNEIKEKVGELKTEISEWPIDQKASFMAGISEGLCLALVIAEEAGVKLAKDANLYDLSKYLCEQKCPPVKKRAKSTRAPTCARGQLADDIKKLLLRSVACRLRIPKITFDTSLDVEDLVTKYFFIIVAIANRSKLDDAIQDIRIMRTIAGGGLIDRLSVRSEVETCYDEFNTEIASVERFNEMTKNGNFRAKDIWLYLRSVERLDSEYEDDELQEIDARYRNTA